MFKITSDYQPTGDQPKAIAQLVEGVNRGEPAQTLLGVTGSGKTFTIANVIQKVEKPTLVLSHNKTLAAQLYGEFKYFWKGGIIDFKDVYFCGTHTAKKHVGDLNTQSANFGYDDDRGDYNIVIGDHLAYRYEIVDVLGKGSFGQVVRCVDHKTGVLVAVKIIRNKKRFHQQALVEVNILQKLKINTVKKNGFIDYMKSIGKLGGQNKLPRLSNDRKIAEAMQSYVE